MCWLWLESLIVTHAVRIANKFKRLSFLDKLVIVDFLTFFFKKLCYVLLSHIKKTKTALMLLPTRDWIEKIIHLYSPSFFCCNMLWFLLLWYLWYHLEWINITLITIINSFGNFHKQKFFCKKMFKPSTNWQLAVFFAILWIINGNFRQYYTLE